MRRWARATAALAVLAALGGPVPAEKPVVAVRDTPVVVRAAGWTVADALRAAHRNVRPGALRSVVSGRVLDASANPPRVVVDERPAAHDTPLRADDRIDAADGVDSVEAVVERRVDGPEPALPPVETDLWRPGRPAVDHEVVGSVSGEVVSRRPVASERSPEPERDKVLALTFDDGPDPRWTPPVLAILHDEGVPATFCVLAEPGRRFPDLVRAEREAGHDHCDHTVNHPHLSALSHDGVTAEIRGGADFLASVDGTPPALFRAPFGDVPPDAIAVAHDAGLRVVGWSVDPHDYLKPPADTIVARVMASVHRGAIILLHDGGGDREATVAALRPLIQALKAKGYRFSTPTREPPVPAAALPSGQR